MASMSTLPTEMLAEILSRLPAKLLLRYKRVCKSWYSLLKSPNFIKLHVKKTLISDSDHHILLAYASIYSAELNFHRKNLSFSELNHPLKPRSVNLIGTCNGVVCIADESLNNIFLLNPITNSHLKLPLNDILVPGSDHVVFGFGFDSENDDYKVFRLVMRIQNNQVLNTESKIYSLRNNSWKCVKYYPYNLCIVNSLSVYVNDAVHWIVVDKEEVPSIASFDFVTESYSLVEFPKFDDKRRSSLSSNMNALELGGCFCLLIDYFTMIPETLLQPGYRQLDRVDLWVMKEFGKKESWVRVFSICQPASIGADSWVKAVLYSKDKRKILLELDCVKFGWYDLVTGRFERFRTRGLLEPPFVTGSFVGSLVSLVDDKMQSAGATMPKKLTKKNNVDTFLSKGFKLRL